MFKKILIGLVSIIILACIAFYFTTRPKLEADGSYSPSKLALSLATVDVSDFENVTYQLMLHTIDLRFNLQHCYVLQFIRQSVNILVKVFG